MDISIYTDESQLNKSNAKKRKKADAADDTDSDVEPLSKKAAPATKKEVSFLSFLKTIKKRH